MILNAQFSIDDQVRVIRNIRNDGSVAGVDKGAMLMRRGETGFVRHVGMFLQEQIIYQVHFLEHDVLLGCRENELISAEKPWRFNIFEYGDKARLTCPLRVKDKLIAERGDEVAILGVDRTSTDIEYRVQLNEYEFWLAENRLRAIETV